jgi:hypothetical protein
MVHGENTAKMEFLTTIAKISLLRTNARRFRGKTGTAASGKAWG